MRRILRLSFALLLLSCNQFSQAEDWPQFRGPGSQGASSASNIPAAWDDNTNITWKVELPGAGASSPIALNNRLYLTCYSGYGLEGGSSSLDDLKLHFVCIDQASGDEIFRRTLDPTLPESDRVRDHGYAAATPATDGKFVYVFFGKSGVVKFDLEGKQVWRKQVGDGTHKWGCGTSPVLFNDLVIVNASVESKSLIALSQETGDEVWRAEGMVSSWNTPHLVKLDDGRTELVVSVKNQILAYDPQTGKQLWTCDGIQDYVCPSIISDKGIIYAVGGRKSVCIAVRAGGKGDVTETHRLWEAKAGANVSSPVLHDGHLYWVSDRIKVAYCVDIKDGSVVYQQRFPGQPYASTLFADGKLFVVSRYSGTYVLAAEPEFKQLSHNKLSDSSTFNSSPIVADGKLILRSDKFLYCISGS